MKYQITSSTCYTYESLIKEWSALGEVLEPFEGDYAEIKAESLEEVFTELIRTTGETRFVVDLIEDQVTEVEIYNTYRE